MYYELYIDVFFIENFFVDTILLISLKKIMFLKGSYLRIIAGGLAGAGLSSIAVCIMMNKWLKLMVFYIVIPLIMIIVAYRIKNIVLFLKSLIMLYVISIVLGGMLQLIRPKLQNLVIFIFCALAGNILMIKAWKLFPIKRSGQKNLVEVIICEKGKSVKMTGLIDTGNVLKDPVSGDPVCIMDQKNAQYVFEGDAEAGIRFIPFRTVGSCGIIPVKRADQMALTDEYRKYWIEKPLIGICKEKICTNGEYQIILNRDILGGTKNASKRSS